MKKFYLLSLLALSGCGTVFSSSTQMMNFNSNVKNVSIYANGALVCSSVPCQVDMERGSGTLMILAKARGYEDHIEQVRTKINPVSWGNLLSLYSWTTDFATSSMWKYSRDGIYINMKPVNMANAELKKFKEDSAIRHFVLYNYPQLQLEASKKTSGEYIKALSELTKDNEQTLISKVYKSNSEVDLAQTLVN